MISKPKNLITITDFIFNEAGTEGVVKMYYDGTTLSGKFNKPELLLNLVKYLVCELLVASPTVQMEIQAPGLEGLKKYVKLAIDSSWDEVISTTYQSMPTSFQAQCFTALIQDIVDPVNGNTAIASRLQLLTVASTLSDTVIKENTNCLTKLVDSMFDYDRHALPEEQKQTSITGKAFDAEVGLRLTHALGNFFIEGFIGNTKIRITKTLNTVTIFTAPLSNKGDITLIGGVNYFHNAVKAEVMDWLKTLAEKEAPKFI